MSCQTIALWTGRPVRRDPDDGRLALVADPDRGEGGGVRARIAQRDPDAGPHALEDLVGVVLDPAGARV